VDTLRRPRRRLHGLSTAYTSVALEERGQGSGRDVVVVEKSQVGAGASGIAAPDLRGRGSRRLSGGRPGRNRHVRAERGRISPPVTWAVKDSNLRPWD